jgi:cell wall assembly regulator SMI1
VWAEKEAKFMTAVNKIKYKQIRLMNIEKERKKWMDICSCKTRTGMGNFDSIDPAVYQVMSAKSLITDIDKNDIVVEPELPSEK